MYEQQGASQRWSRHRTLGVGASLFLATLAALLVGCGGGGKGGGPGLPAAPVGGRPPGATGTGGVTLTIRWPDATPDGVTAKAIPTASQSLRIRIEDPTNPTLLLAPEALVTRQANSGPVQRSFDGIRVGPVVVRILAFASTDGTGTPLAEATATLTVVVNQRAPAQVLLAAVQTVAITPNPATVGVGQTLPLAAASQDSAGHALFVPSGNLTWQSLNLAVVTVNAGGVVTGVSDGTATVRVTESQSAQSATTTVNVDGTPPQITPDSPPAFIGSVQPAIAATLSDAGVGFDIPSALSAGNVTLRLDNQPQTLTPANFLPTSGTTTKMAFTPTTPLKEGDHVASLQIADIAGNRSTQQWTFRVDVTPPQLSSVRALADLFCRGQLLEVGLPNTDTFCSVPREFRANVFDPGPSPSGADPTVGSYLIVVRQFLNANGVPVTGAPNLFDGVTGQMGTTAGVITFVLPANQQLPTISGAFDVQVIGTDRAGNPIAPPAAAFTFVVGFGS